MPPLMYSVNHNIYYPTPDNLIDISFSGYSDIYGFISKDSHDIFVVHSIIFPETRRLSPALNN